MVNGLFRDRTRAWLPDLAALAFIAAAVTLFFAAAPSTPAPGTDCFLERTVLAADGTPCAAEVLAGAVGGKEECPRTVPSGADGRYRLVLPPGSHRVFAVAAIAKQELLAGKYEWSTISKRLRAKGVIKT